MGPHTEQAAAARSSASAERVSGSSFLAEVGQALARTSAKDLVGIAGWDAAASVRRLPPKELQELGASGKAAEPVRRTLEATWLLLCAASSANVPQEPPRWQSVQQMLARPGLPGELAALDPRALRLSPVTVAYVAAAYFGAAVPGMDHHCAAAPPSPSRPGTPARPGSGAATRQRSGSLAMVGGAILGAGAPEALCHQQVLRAGRALPGAAARGDTEVPVATLFRWCLWAIAQAGGACPEARCRPSDAEVEALVVRGAGRPTSATRRSPSSCADFGSVRMGPAASEPPRQRSEVAL